MTDSLNKKCEDEARELLSNLEHELLSWQKVTERHIEERRERQVALITSALLRKEKEIERLEKLHLGLHEETCKTISDLQEKLKQCEFVLKEEIEETKFLKDKIQAIEEKLKACEVNLKSRFNDWLIRGDQIKALESNLKTAQAINDANGVEMIEMKKKLEIAMEVLKSIKSICEQPREFGDALLVEDIAKKALKQLGGDK